jgi:Asp-tRNA(Asn)/Glu-tRNA(Gln) amidotransferase C subunit
MERFGDRDKLMQADIERMLALFEKIREVDTEGVEPMHTLPYEGAFSAEASPEPSADEADVTERTVDVRKLNAPQMRGALFEVPYTLEGEAGKNG